MHASYREATAMGFCLTPHASGVGNRFSLDIDAL
jgi:hypothetical protein